MTLEIVKWLSVPQNPTYCKEGSVFNWRVPINGITAINDIGPNPYVVRRLRLKTSNQHTIFCSVCDMLHSALICPSHAVFGAPLDQVTLWHHTSIGGSRPGREPYVKGALVSCWYQSYCVVERREGCQIRTYQFLSFNIYADTCIPIHIHIHTRLHVHIYTHAYTYTNACTHIHSIVGSQWWVVCCSIQLASIRFFTDGSWPYS